MLSATTLTCLIMLLTNQGFWIGGKEQAVTVSWPLQEGMPAAKVLWVLRYGETVLTKGAGAIDAATGKAEFRIKAPVVRVAVKMNLTVQAIEAATGRELAAIESAVHVYPETVPASLARLKGKKVLVWDRPAGLPAVLNKADVEVTRIDDASAPIAGKVDFVFVGTDQLDDSADTGPLLSLARSGAAVLILRQQRCSMLAGWPLVERRGIGMEGRWSHLVWEGLTQEQWQACLQREEKLMAVRVPRNAAVTPLAWWANELPDDTEPTDLLVASVPMGEGRLVLCQAPVTDWENDPRAGILLGNLVEYLQTPPEPAAPMRTRLQSKEPR